MCVSVKAYWEYGVVMSAWSLVHCTHYFIAAWIHQSKMWNYNEWCRVRLIHKMILLLTLELKKKKKFWDARWHSSSEPTWQTVSFHSTSIFNCSMIYVVPCFTCSCFHFQCLLQFLTCLWKTFPLKTRLCFLLIINSFMHPRTVDIWSLMHQDFESCFTFYFSNFILRTMMARLLCYKTHS